MDKSAIRYSRRLLLFLPLFLAALIYVAWTSRTRRAQYFIFNGASDNFVTYGVAGEPPLPIEDGYYVVRVPVNGRLRTSTPMDDRWARDKFSASTGNGEVSLVRKPEEVRHYTDNRGYVISDDAFDGHTRRIRIWPTFWYNRTRPN